MTLSADRTPYCTKIRYGISGAPILTEDEMDGTYAPGVGVLPVLIELVYSAALKDRPGSVSASVTGLLTRFDTPDEPNSTVNMHFKDGPDGWPSWLVEEARLHNPEPAAQSPADRATAIASCPGYETSPNLCRCPCYGCKHHCSAHNPEDVPEPVDRAVVLSDSERTMLTYALDQAQERIWSEDGFTEEDQAAVDSLRRLACEQPAQGETRPDTLPAWLHWRFGTRGRYGQAWNSLSDDDRTYWEHQARAVRRAVTRGGFKTSQDEARPMLRSSSTVRPGTATVASDMCPRCKGDNTEAWSLCASCASETAAQDKAPVVTVHACPQLGDNGISSCCGRPPCEFVGERVTRDPDKVTCRG